MRVRVGEAARLRELVAYLEARDCTVDVVDETTIDATIDVARRDAAELELDLYLRLWEAVAETAAWRLDE
jgi:hypothetical protein